MAPPRLPAEIEHWVMRVTCGAPAWLQRAALGGAVRLDGQELAPDIQMLLRLAKLTGDESVVEGRTPERARADNRNGAAAVARRPPLPMARVEPLSLPGPAGTIPARLYVGPDGSPGATAAGRASGDTPRQPLLVYFHGGGWCVGGLDTHDGPCRFLATHSGAAVLSVDYRLAPEHLFPAAVDDAFAAFRWAANHAEELGADPERVAVIGDSAGGNLAGAVCLLARDTDGPQPAMQALVYPVTDVSGGQRSRDLFERGFLLTKADMEWFEHHYLGATTDAEDRRVALVRAADLSGLPPAYVTTAGFDPLRDEGEAYATRLREAGVKVALRRHPGLIHGFANLTAVSRTARAAMQELAGALRMGLG